jgi:nucleotide-binding universal stress UspA family protein
LLGHPATLINAYAEEQRADLIVIGARGTSAVSRFLLGSVAERVVRHAHVPVLTVPPADESDEVQAEAALASSSRTA